MWAARNERPVEMPERRERRWRMILVFGGAYQGKTAYALQTFGRAPADVFVCERDGRIDWSRSVISGLENFVWACARRGLEAKDILAAALAQDAAGRSPAAVTAGQTAGGCGAESSVAGRESAPVMTSSAGAAPEVARTEVAADAADAAADRTAQSTRCGAERILIACDISQGLVPMDPQERAYREMMGRTLVYLAGEARCVHRVFCGLGQRLK